MKQETKDSLIRYAEHGIPTGGFLKAVLSNNLTDSVARADEENLLDLYQIVIYVYNEMPSLCHGSPERVAAWIETHRLKRQQQEEAAARKVEVGV